MGDFFDMLTDIFALFVGLVITVASLLIVVSPLIFVGWLIWLIAK